LNTVWPAVIETANGQTTCDDSIEDDFLDPIRISQDFTRPLPAKTENAGENGTDGTLAVQDTVALGCG
jgi:hypothetical protein